jgi:hypothetical protein
MKLTRRGEILFKVLLIAGAGLLFWGVFEVVGNLWWTGSGYCWGSMVECMAGGL